MNPAIRELVSKFEATATEEELNIVTALSCAFIDTVISFCEENALPFTPRTGQMISAALLQAVVTQPQIEKDNVLPEAKA